MPASPFRYRHHGLSIASWIELPELDCRRLPPEPNVDLSIVASSLDDVGNDWPGTAGLRAAGGAALFSYANLGRFLVRHGVDVAVDLLPGADPALVRSCLLTAVMPMVCHQRGLMVLHASAVALGHCAIAFAGESGAGKSTLAAHCVQLGAKLLADDILVPTMAADGSVLVHPGTSLLKLKTHALQSLGITSRGLAQENPDEDKFLLPVVDQLAQESLPLRRLHILADDDAAGEGTCTPLSGGAALAALVEHSFAQPYLDVIGRRGEHFAHCCRLAGRIEIVRLSRRRDVSALPRTAALIRHLLQSREPVA